MRMMVDTQQALSRYLWNELMYWESEDMGLSPESTSSYRLLGKLLLSEPYFSHMTNKNNNPFLLREAMSNAIATTHM